MSNYVVGGKKKKKNGGRKKSRLRCSTSSDKISRPSSCDGSGGGKNISINSVTARAAAQAGSDANLRVSQPLNGSSAMFS